MSKPEPFDSAAELAGYYRLKWSIAIKSTFLAIVVALALLAWNWYASLAVAVGFGCGLANVLGIMRGSERLVQTRNPLVFGLSSLLRLAGFSIVAAALATRGPWWSLGPFLAGFFFPLAAYALGAARHNSSMDR